MLLKARHDIPDYGENLHHDKYVVKRLTNEILLKLI